MTMIDIHSNALISKNTIYHEFLLRYAKNSKVVYGFVEGKEDPSFYRSFIESLLPDDWSVELWLAGNKDRVYEIHREMDWRRFKKYRICFFVDRDLSGMIPETFNNDANIYVSPGYSIENEIVNKATCERVLSELCGFGKANHGDLEAVSSIFVQELEAFVRAMVPIMAWILLWRRCGNRPNLNDIHMRDLFTVTKGRLRLNANPKGKETVYMYIHEQCGVNYDPKINIDPIQAEFSRERGNCRNLIRGKFVFWFLIEFCLAVHREASLFFKGMAKPPKMHLNLSCSNGIALIGPRSRIPRSLRDFLNSTFCLYIEKVTRRCE